MKIINFFIRFLKKEVKVFPEHYHPKCFDCNKGHCRGCENYNGF
jgi:hypothetical protein